MTDAPKMIALRWQPGAAVTSGPLMDHHDYTRYVRQDMTHPIEAAADAVERELADLRAKLAVAVEALDEIEDGWTDAADDDTGELVAVRVSDDEMVEIARAALAKVKGGE